VIHVQFVLQVPIRSNQLQKSKTAEKPLASFLQKALSSLAPPTRQLCVRSTMSVLASLHEDQCRFCKAHGHWKDECPDPRSHASVRRSRESKRVFPKSFAEAVKTVPSVSSLNLQQSIESLSSNPSVEVLHELLAQSRKYVALLELLLRRCVPWLQDLSFQDQIAAAFSPAPSSPLIVPTSVQDELPDAADFLQPVSVPAAAEIAVAQPVSVPAAAEIAVDQPVSVPAAAEIAVDQPVSVPAAAEIAVAQPVSVPAAAEIAVDQPVSVSAAEIAVAEALDVQPELDAYDVQPESEADDVQPVSAFVAMEPGGDQRVVAATAVADEDEWDGAKVCGWLPAHELYLHSYSCIAKADISLEEMRLYDFKEGKDRLEHLPRPKLLPDKSPLPTFVWPQPAVPQPRPKPIDKPAVIPSTPPPVLESKQHAKHQYSEAEKEDDARNLIAFPTRPADLEKPFQVATSRKNKKNQKNLQLQASRPVTDEFEDLSIRSYWKKVSGRRAAGASGPTRKLLPATPLDASRLAKCNKLTLA